MISIGWRNLRRDRMRMLVAVLGVLFAVVLVTIECGMLLGLMQNASILIDRGRADLWISKVDIKTFDFGTPFDRRKRYLIESIPDVEKLEEYNVSYTMWQLPTGGNASVQIVGFNPRDTLYPPLDLTEGSVEQLHNQDTIIIDESERPKLGYPKLGDTVEIMHRRAKIVGFTRGMRAFTTTPFIFTSLPCAHRYGWITEEDKTVIYYLVKVREGADPSAVASAINAAVPGIEAHTREEFSWRTRKYWLIETGVGVGFVLAALLGLLVGGIIVSQTLYAMTVEKLPEFGVLKALGASMTDVGRIVVEQGLICGAAGLLLGLPLCFMLAHAATSAGTAVKIPPALTLSVVVLTATLCVSAALISILRLRKLEPAAVFRT